MTGFVWTDVEGRARAQQESMQDKVGQEELRR